VSYTAGQLAEHAKRDLDITHMICASYRVGQLADYEKRDPGTFYMSRGTNSPIQQESFFFFLG
jgi:hypothetical protein